MINPPIPLLKMNISTDLLEKTPRRAFKGQDHPSNHPHLPLMNTPSLRPRVRVLRPLFAACLFLTALLPLPAENWQTFDIRLPAGRFQHTLSMEVTGSGSEMIWGTDSPPQMQ